MLKQIYHIVALLAVLHLLVLLGLGAFMVATGRLDTEKVERIAAVIRGDETPVESKAATSQPTVTPVLAMGSSEKIAEAQSDEEVARLTSERLLREAVDRKALVDASMLKVTRQLEALAKQRQEFEQARALARQADQQGGLKAELEIVSSLSEKKARDLLMKKEVPEAVRILMKMKTRSAAGIIDACKTETEKAWAVQVMQEIANQDQDHAQQLAKTNR